MIPRTIDPRLWLLGILSAGVVGISQLPPPNITLLDPPDHDVETVQRFDLGYAAADQAGDAIRDAVDVPDVNTECDVTYRTVAEINAINSDTTNDIYCIDPTNSPYITTQPITITIDGASTTNRKVLICKEALNANPENNGCSIRGLRFNNADNWSVIGMKFDLGGANAEGIVIYNDSDNFVLYRSYVTNTTNNFIRIIGGSDNALFQENVICDAPRPLAPGVDRGEQAGIFAGPSYDEASTINQGVDNLHVYGNEFCNIHGDGIQLHHGSSDRANANNNNKPDVTFDGVKIVDNDFYWTPELVGGRSWYVDQDGTPNPNGIYSAFENCIDTKRSVQNPTDTVGVIAYNRCLHTRKTASSAFTNSSGIGDDYGCAWIFQWNYSDNIQLYSNIAHDVSCGFDMQNIPANQNRMIRYNLFSDCNVDGNAESKGCIRFSENGFNTAEYNTFVNQANQDRWLKYDSINVTFRFNNIINGGGTESYNTGSFGGTISDNRYWGTTTVPPEDTNPVDNTPTVPSSGTFSFTYKQLTNPTTVNVTNGLIGVNTQPSYP